MRRGFLFARKGRAGGCVSRRLGRDGTGLAPGIVMEKNAGFMKALKCRECGREYPLTATHVCEFDFGPLEVVYDYDRIRQSLHRSGIQSRPQTMWRYRELLPVAGEPTVGFEVGFTPLIKADRLARRLGVREVWVKNDTVNYPTLSFKDRVVSVALSRARELGFTTVACASTGNLANSVAAKAPRAWALKSSSSSAGAFRNTPWCPWPPVRCSRKSRRAIRNSSNSAWCRQRPITCMARRRRVARRLRPRKRPAWISSNRSNQTPSPSRSPSARRRTVSTRCE